MSNISNNEILNFALENGIIDINTIQTQIEMRENKKYLEMHPYKIWKGSDGQYHTYLPDKEKGRIPKKRKTEEEINKIIIDYWKEDSINPTIEDVFHEWIDRRLELKKISPATHIRQIQIFNRHFEEFGKQKIKQLQADDLIDFLEEQIPKFNLTSKAFSNLKGIVRGFMKRAKKLKLVDFNIETAFYDLDISETDFKKVIKEDIEEVFDEDETECVIDYLLEHLDNKNMAILLMFVTGIRVGELVALKNEVIFDNYFKIRRTETKFKSENEKYYTYTIKEYPKSDAGVRTVVVPHDYEWLLTKIKLLNPFGEYVFLNTKGERMTTNCIRSRLKIVCKNAMVYRKSPHKIRKTYGSILLDNHIDNRLIAQQMGHASIDVTENNYHRNRKKLDKKSKVISQIPEFGKKIV